MRAKLAILACAAVSLAPLAARADVTRQQCVESYDRAQYLKKESKLRDARAVLLVCASDACPTAVRNDCVPWLAEVEAATPTISVGVRDDQGKDVTGARVSIDGVAQPDAADGRAVPVDPGKHTIHVETSDGRAADEAIVARASEKNRLVTIVLKTGAASAAGATDAAHPAPETPSPAPAPAAEGRSIALPLGLTVVGAAGLGAAFVFGFSAKGEANDLRSSCAPACKDSDLDPVRAKLLYSDIGLGIGVVALAAATYFWLKPGASASSPSKATGGIVVTGSAKGGSVGIGF